MKMAKIFAHFSILGCKILRFRVLELFAFFGVFSGKIFFISKFSSFEGVILGFWKIFVKKFRRGRASSYGKRGNREDLGGSRKL
jgi:hypothetical protein